MIFLQMVNGLRHYPVASAGAQAFRIPLIKRNWSAYCAYQGAASDLGYNMSGFSTRRIFKKGD
jgi:hypothetical protein